MARIHALCSLSTCTLLAGSLFAAEAGASAGAGEDWYGRLARHWAPVIFQDVAIGADNPLGRYDFLSSAVFDGDQAGGNNWENSDDSRRAEPQPSPPTTLTTRACWCTAAGILARRAARAVPGAVGVTRLA